MSKYAAPKVPFISARWKGGKNVPEGGGIVIHGTVSPCVKGGARSVAHYFATETGKTSAHYVVDPGEVIQCVGDHTIAYHCGYNTNTLGIELCDPQTGAGARWNDAAHKAMLARAATLVAQLCLAYGIEVKHPTTAALKARGVHGIYGHNDSRLAFGHTTHTDPGPAFPWLDFLKDVEAEVTRLKGGKEAKKKSRGKNVDAAIADATASVKATKTALTKPHNDASHPTRRNRLTKALSQIKAGRALLKKITAK